MKRLQYLGSEPYKDPGLRFELKKDDLIDFEDAEADSLLNRQPDMWKEVNQDASVGSSGGSVPPNNSSGSSV